MEERKRILVVDDEPSICEGLRQVLTKQGHSVTTASSGHEGLAKALNDRFDIMIVDLKMPDLDGLELIKRVKKDKPQLATIVITGHASKESAIDAVKAGVVDYIEKPFAPADIITVIERSGKITEASSIGDLVSALAKTEIKISGVDSKTPPQIGAGLRDVIGVQKGRSPFINLLILGVFAGVYIGFGAALATLISNDASKFVGLGLGQLASGVAFSVGLMLVVIAGAELFTGNNLILTSWASGKVKTNQLLYNWTVVYLANFLGSLLLVAIMYYSNLWKTADMAIGARVLAIADAKVNLGFVEAFARGIGCNWLVCLAVWLALAAREVSGKILAILFPITTFVALGFEHCVANMYFIPMGLFLKSTPAATKSGLELVNLSWGNFVIKNLIPVTLGNIVGGAIFVGLLYWIVYLRAKKTA